MFISLFLDKPFSLKKQLPFIPFLFLLNTALAQQKYWQQKVDYNITVSLNDLDNSLSGFEQMTYYNNSPDTLNYIWFHLWPNAYKNDRTAFSDQMLENRSTAFYFSEENKKGYINQLSFKVDNVNAVTEDHPAHQDIVKLMLPKPLAPGNSIKIETPFHAKLPYNFSRGGHIDQSYQVTQWYPKPAVYDKAGWHEMPYLDQGEFYSEYGAFDVKITLPSNYIVAATGALQDEENRQWLKALAQKEWVTVAPTIKSSKIPAKEKLAIKTADPLKKIPSATTTRTLHYIQDNVHDFAWFADKTFRVQADTLKLASGKIIDVYSFVLPANAAVWKNSIQFSKQAILTKSKWLGEYPYNMVSVVDNAAPTGGGMEYPTITLLTAGGSEKELDRVINHEIGHNWFYGILGTNERSYPWMDEGMNTFYDKRYENAYPYPEKDSNGFFKKRIPENLLDLVLQTYYTLNKDQPINTTSEKFSEANYGLVGYEKAGQWMMKLQKELGNETFDKLMQTYFEKWKFKHPTVEDFKAVAEEVSGKSLDTVFALLNAKGPLYKPAKKDIKLTSFFNLKDADKHNYISIAPAFGANFYDKLMLGVLLHNYSMPPSNVRFVVAPLYAIGTSKLNGIGRVEYGKVVGTKDARFVFSVSGSKFTGGSFKDSTGTKNPLQFSKIVPSVKYEFANKNPRNSFRKYVQFKSYLINETNILFARDYINNKDIITYPTEKRYVNQLQFVVENKRVLYPYDAVFQAEQADGFVRLNVTGNYYFNYQKGGGLNVRFFAGKFIYTGDKGFTNQFKTDIYHLNLSGPKGYEDYNYINYFVGRNEFEGFSNQQIMKRDGFFKVRTDLLSNKIGKTDDWLSAVNLTTDIPKSVNIFNALPIKIPVRLFVDIGTFAEAWKKDAETGRFLYDAGLQVSIFKNVLNIYVPIVYSKVYSDYFKSTIPEKRFLKNISFTLDLQQLKFSTLAPQAGL